MVFNSISYQNELSQIELWPIQVCINELPFRIGKDNVLLCGFMVWSWETKYEHFSLAFCRRA